MVWAIILVTASIFALLLWAQGRRWREKHQRQQGVTTVAVGNGHKIIGGCLGALAYFGLLSVAVWLTLDLLEETDSPGWIAWVMAIGLLAGFFAIILWASVGVGPSFARTRLVLDSNGIRLVRLGKTQVIIQWHEPWQLDQFASIHFKYRHLGENYTDRTLWLRLRQRNNQLLLRFNVEDEHVRGLPSYEGEEEGYGDIELAEWVEAEILQRYMMGKKAAELADVEKKTKETKLAPDSLSVSPPDSRLMEALDFTEEDLVFNREGAYKARQLAPMRRDQWITLATYIVLILLFGGMAGGQILRLVRKGWSETTGAAAVVLILACGFCVLMAVASYAGLQIEIPVFGIRGRITLQHYQESGEYWLRVKDTAIPISKEVFDAFEDQALYILYFAGHDIGDQDKRLISAEKIEE